MLHRRDFLKTAALLAGPAMPQQPAAPNVVLVVSDSGVDSGADFDRLARDGVRCTRAYAAYPSAGPSQAALITGKFPHACGVLRDGDHVAPNQPSIAAQFKAAGYITAFIGDWRLGVAAQSFDYRSLDFLKQPRGAPFFIYHSSNQPIGGFAAPDTIIVATSAYGSTVNSPFEDSAHVPLVIRYPRKLPAGRTIDALISTVDIMPTLLGLSGVEVPSGVQGQDLSAMVTGSGGTHPESIYSTGKLGTPEEWRMVVRGVDKIVVNHDLDVTHLYNLADDPNEMDNQARDKTQIVRRDALEALLKEWMRRTGDGVDPSGLKRRQV